MGDGDGAARASTGGVFFSAKNDSALEAQTPELRTASEIRPEVERNCFHIA
jgi:hypothetical protein